MKENLPNVLRARLWLVVQALSAFTMIVSPLWMKNDFQASPELKKLISTVSRTPTSIPSISSRIIHLPPPKLKSRLDFTVETRQFRFGYKPQPVKEQSHALQRIERKNEQSQWEDVELVSGESNSSLGTIFLELNEGANLFRATFADAKGSTSAYEVSVHFKGSPPERQ